MTTTTTIGPTNIQLIKKFFDNVGMAEMKDLTKDDRQELGDLIRALMEEEEGQSGG